MRVQRDEHAGEVSVCQTVCHTARKTLCKTGSHVAATMPGLLIPASVVRLNHISHSAPGVEVA